MSIAADSPQSSADRVPVEDVLAWIDANLTSLPPQDVAVVEAAGRIVSQDVPAPIDLPPFDRAATDGYAVRADETVGASAYSPLAFRLSPTPTDLPAGGIVRVNAGGALPAGADAVVPAAHVAPDTEGTVTVIEPVAAGSDVERAGSHATRGSRLVVAGRLLNPRDIGMLASAGLARVSVTRRPRVRCLLAGGPSIEAGRPLSPGAVYDCNGPMLRALIERDGGVVVEQHYIERDRAGIGAALTAPGSDIVLVAGGTGAGHDDHAAAALADSGELAMHGVAFGPAETAGVGRLAGGTPMVLLPGAPAACLWAYEMFAGRMIRRLAGRDPELPFPCRRMTAARKIVSTIGMLDVCPVQCLGEDRAAPIASFAEAGLASAARGDGFVLVPPASEGYPQGAALTVYLFPGRARGE